MSVHTPGPWEVHSQDAHLVHSRNSQVAIIYETTDAALIAAAPDLLAALEALLKADLPGAIAECPYNVSGAAPVGVVRVALDAIAKARGQ